MNGHPDREMETALPARPPSLLESAHAHHIWLQLEAPEIIELRQVAMDRDAPGAVEFFHRVIAPRVQMAAQQRGLDVDWEGIEAGDGHLPG